ncbi:MAG: ATP-dependent RecD-like DNA helicase [Firmicutes bacterium]|nr:ATP-dependent RecD-like DNA helicase [Bacillota bacterium]MDD4707759.1 ATP-dependent RecD-like DNA helicase [Bacillota bacterium]
MLELEGTVSGIVYRNQNNGYTILRFNCEDDQITLVGYMPLVREGEDLKIKGEWVYHPVYGEQVQVSGYSAVAPSTLEGIEKYLASGLIPGIGPKTAKKIVGTLGKDSLDIIQYNPMKLTTVDGIGKKKAQRIAQAFEEQRGLRDVMIFLQSYDISTAFAVRIYKKYREETVKLIKQNPYRLVDDIEGIGFKRADKIAMSMGIEPNSPGRVYAGTKHVLTEFAGAGHVFVPREKLASRAAALMEVEKQQVEDAIESLAIAGQLKLEQGQGGQVVYHMPFYYAESSVAARLVELALMDYDTFDLDLERETEDYEEKNLIVLDRVQKEAVVQSIQNGIVVITGGPGTGKTTTIKAIIDIFEGKGLKVALAAPTGRAAKRMAQACDREASTIHRLLEFTYHEEKNASGFGRDEENPLDCEVLIIDEISMADILLMHYLLKAVRAGTRLVMVGDVDQLPSVGPGNVLKDIIGSGVVKVVRLKRIFRQEGESSIVANAHRINEGRYPVTNSRDGDFFFIEKRDMQQVVETVIDLCKNRLPRYNGYNPMTDIQVLSPMRKGQVGVDNLNNKLREILNPAAADKGEKKSGNFVFRVGDRVMQIKNNYTLRWETDLPGGGSTEGEGVFNGDLGIIKSLDEEEGQLEVLFDDERRVCYRFNQLDELEPAYAVTVHKSQGSEFPVMVMPVFWGPPMLVTRNLLYTALTRAKELAVLVGREEFLHRMVDNNRISSRYSALDWRMRDIISRF